MSMDKKPIRKNSWFLGLFVEFLILTVGLFIVDGNVHTPVEIFSGALMLIFLVRLFVYASKKD